jgi:MFS family permease
MNKRSLVRTLFIISFFEVVARNLFGPVFAVYVNKIGGDLLASGTALAIGTATLGLFIIISGRIASKYHTERIQLVIGYGLAALAYLGFIFVKSPTQLFMVEALSGLAAAIEMPAFSGLFSSFLKQRHASSWGDYFGVMNFVSAGALFISGVISQQYGFRTLFFVMFATQLMGMFAAIYLYRFRLSND